MRTRKYLLLAVAVLTPYACLKPYQRPTTTASDTNVPTAQTQDAAFAADLKPEPVGGLAALQAKVHQPDEVWKENRFGTAVVAATISSNGRVVETRIVQSSGSAAMDAEAMLAVARASWNPGRQNGEPVTATVEVPIQFGPNY